MKPFRPVLLLYPLPAVLLALCPSLHDALLYDRAAIGQGELWRLWTGHWIHFSASHLGWNLLVLLLAGAWLEKARPGLLVRYTALAAPLISVGFLALTPDMQTYGGLSGLATGVVVLLAFTGLGRRSPDRAWAAGLLILVAVKLAVEATQTEPLFAGFGMQAVRSSVMAHAAGAAAALALFFVRPFHPRFAPNPPSPTPIP